MSERMTKSDITIRPYENRDFQEFSECLFGFYGSGYPYREYLNPDYLNRITTSGELILTVAVLPDGKIIGTVGAQYMHGAFEGSVLLLLRNIKTEYRGMGISSYQLNDLLNRVSVSFPNAVSMYADVMTHDTISQNSLVHRGYTLTALRLMVYKNKIIVPHLNYPEHTKMTQAVYCKSLLSGGNVTLYAPDELQKVIRQIYSGLNIDVRFADEGSTIEAEQTLSEIHFNEIHAHTEIIISKPGNNLDLEIKNVLKQHNAYEDLTATVYLNMNEQGSKAAYEILKHNGFYFSGIKPLSKAGEYIILSKTDRCRENFSDICLPENEIQFKNYIEQKHIKNEVQI